MNSSKNISTPENCQTANFNVSSELVHIFIDFSQPLEQLNFNQFFFTLVESKIFQNRQKRKR